MNNETFQSYNGTCSSKTHVLTITMLDGLTTISLEFTLNDKNQTSLTRVLGGFTINDNTSYFPNYTKSAEGPHAFIGNESLFVTDRSNSYRCNSKTSIGNFKADGNATIKSIDIEDLRIQPFVDNKTIFNDYAVGMLNLVFRK